MQDLDKFKNEMNLSGKNVYVGHRYVPKIFGEWDNTKIYEPLSIVQYQGNSFTSRQYVPVGIEITNEEFWVSTGNYNAQIEQYRLDVKNVEESIETVEGNVTTNTNDILSINNDITTIENDLTTIDNRIVNVLEMVEKPSEVIDWIPYINEAIERASISRTQVYFPNYEYIVKPTQENFIILRNGVNLLGANHAVIKVAANNPDFFYLMTGKDGRLVGCTIDGLTFDTNAENQTSSVSMENEKKRIIFRVQTASDLRFINNKFLYSGVNAIITHGSLYNHKNNVIAHNYFKFTNQSDTTYDNTACYIGQIGHQIVNNIFESTTDVNGITARTCIETHASYGVVEGNIIKNYMSGVLVLGEDNNQTVGNMAPKVISNNIIVDCLGGVLMWSSASDVKHVTVSGNSIYINNVTRGRFAEGFYGIAIDHNSGGLIGANNITDVNITGNNIKFEVSTDWLTSSKMPEISEYNFEGAFAIGSYTGSSRSTSIKNILISDNQIINSPRMPFSFVNNGFGTYENITIQNNGLFECITQRMLPIQQKTGLYIAGKVEYLNYIGNNFTDNRNTTYMVSEISTSKVLTNLKRIRIKNNSFLLKQGTISGASYLPPINKGEKWEVESVKVKYYNNADSMKEETLFYNDIITLGLQTDGRNTFLVTKSGTIKSESLEGDWVIEGSVLKVPENIDVKTLYGGNIIKIVKADDTVLFESTQIIGVDYVNREVLISNTSSYNGPCKVSYGKPATNNGVLNNTF